VAILGGRQIGKDFTIAFYCAWMMVSAPGWNCVVMSATNDDAKQFMRDVRLHYTAFEALCKRAGCPIPPLKTDSATLIVNRANSTVRAVSATERGLLGTRGTVIFNEVPSIEAARELLPSALAQVTQQNIMRGRKDARLVLIGNASYVGSFWHEWWSDRWSRQEAGAGGDWTLIKQTWSDAMRDMGHDVAQIAEMRDARIEALSGNEAAFDQWFECVFRSVKGLMYDPDLVARASYSYSGKGAPALRGPQRIGYDVGRINDLTAFSRLVEEVNEEHYALPTVTLRASPFPEQRARLLSLCEERTTKGVVVDFNGVGLGQIDELRALLQGVAPLHDGPRGPASRYDLHSRLKSLMEQGRVFVPREDKDLLMEMSAVEATLTANDTPTVKTVRKGGSHADRLTSLALAASLLTHRRYEGVAAPEAIKGRRTARW
jgi:phage FluMu gp28-like protein